ncbi:hypothetical protein JCM19274_2562 [Algibacter lectus]|uniref:Uncharacterized protein n=1 Tax=Algibacter lectus TaxID=221126 RepID=A0A090WS00_9FLAO|nr:hypothetical protein JCM19274_2562 [Algibacter lectus]
MLVNEKKLNAKRSKTILKRFINYYFFAKVIILEVQKAFQNISSFLKPKYTPLIHKEI